MCNISNYCWKNFTQVCVEPDGPCSIHPDIPNPTFNEVAHIVIAVHLNTRKSFVPEDASIVVTSVSVARKWTCVHLFDEHESKLTMH